MVDITPYTVYLDYLAFKRHFTEESYDYVKYNGKVTAKYSTYEKRADKFQFEKLSRKKNPSQILLANLSVDPDAWIGDIVSDDDKYVAWKKAISSIEYRFSEEVKRLDYDDFDSNFRVVDGEYPPLLELHRKGEVSRETMLILNRLLGFTGHWNKCISDPVLWPKTFFLLKKYSAFVPVDVDKYKAALKKAVDCNT